MLDFSKFNWDDIKKYGSSVLAISVTDPGMIEELDSDDREQLLVVDKYVSHREDSYGPKGFVKVFKIVDRVIDNRGNLLLFVEVELVEFER